MDAKPYTVEQARLRAAVLDKRPLCDLSLAATLRAYADMKEAMRFIVARSVGPCGGRCVECGEKIHALASRFVKEGE